MRGSMQQPNYYTIYENNFMKEKCLRVMQGGYNMNIICNQKFMFCKDRGIDFRINNNCYIKIK